MDTNQHSQIRPRVLFVDDSKLMRLSGRKILNESFDVVLAENAEQARQLLDQDPTIQLMFSDLNMPGQSGYDLLAELRKDSDSRLSRLPIIIITGSDNQETERQRALELGATDFIIKPFRASELMARARAHATHEEAVRRLQKLESALPMDPATGLGNRRYCIQRLDQALSFARRHGQPLSLIHLHVKGLSALLDDLGEPFASSAQKRIGQALGQPIRREDTVFRTGPESFSFILPATDAAGAEILRRRFIPDLQEMGLIEAECALAVECHFAVHSPDPQQREAAEAVLASGLNSELRPAHPQASDEQEQAVPGLDLELALRWIKAGQLDQVRPHLDSLMAQIEPLLELAAATGSTGPQLRVSND
jgi:two-component system, cell cycle response regulator